MAMPEASSTAIIIVGGLCVPQEFTATLPRVAVQVRQQFLDAFYAGQAHRGCSASLVAARCISAATPGVKRLA
jgi:hypothetical protein